MAIFKIILTLISILGGLLAIIGLGLISLRDGVGLFIIILSFYICSTLSIRNEIKPLTKTIERIEDFLVRLSATIQTRGRLENLNLYEKRSPLEVTDEGMKILEKIGFRQDIDNNISQLFKMIDKSQPQNPFDAEQYSIGLISHLIMTKTGIFNRAENFLFNNPEYNHSEIFKTAGLYLRDKYLEMHPELLKN